MLSTPSVDGVKYQHVVDAKRRWCLGPVVDNEKTAKHLDSVFRHNFRESLTDHANPQRSDYLDDVGLHSGSVGDQNMTGARIPPVPCSARLLFSM